MYRRSINDPLSTVLTTKGAEEIVVVCTSWDMATGSLWDGVDVPESLRCHAAVASACFATVDTWDKVHFGAFGGVKKGYPKELLIPTLLFCWIGGARMGYSHRFGYTVHPSMLAWMNSEKDKRQTDGEHSFGSNDQTWEVAYSGIDAPEGVKKELAEIKHNFATCTLTDLSAFRDQYELIVGSIDTNMRPLFDQINEAVMTHLRRQQIPIVESLVSAPPAMQMSAVPVSSKL